jgi:hypothetical protein
MTALANYCSSMFVDVRGFSHVSIRESGRSTPKELKNQQSRGIHAFWPWSASESSEGSVGCVGSSQPLFISNEAAQKEARLAC